MYVCENSTGSAYCFYGSMIPTVSCILSTNCSHSNTVRRLKEKSGGSYFCGLKESKSQTSAVWLLVGSFQARLACAGFTGLLHVP